MKKVNIAEGATLLLLLLWSHAASSKFLDHANFRFQLLGHPLLKNHATLLAWLVPAIESGIVLLLLFPRTKKAGLYASVMLLTMFTAYIVTMLLFFPHRPCACSGVLSGLGWTSHLFLNLGFLIVGMAGINGMSRESIKNPA